MLAIPTRVIAACFALVSFAATAMVGVAVGNSATSVIRNATVVMALCWVIGWLVGLVTWQCIDEHIDQYKQANPIPGDSIDQHVTEAQPAPAPSAGSVVSPS